MPRNNNDFHGSIKYHTSSSLARELGVSVRTVRRAAAKGIIKHSTTLGGHRRYSSEEADKLKKQLNMEPLGMSDEG